MRRSFVSTARREASVGVGGEDQPNVEGVDRLLQSLRPELLMDGAHGARHPGLVGGALLQGSYAVDLLRGVGQQEVLG